MKQQEKFSGKFVLRTGPELHKRLRTEALSLGVSLNELCVRKLSSNGFTNDHFADLGLDRKFLESVVRSFPSKPLAIVLFGSFARRQSGPQSDLDLLIVFTKGTSLTRSLYDCFDDCADIAHFRHVPNPHLVCLPDHAEDAGSIWLEVAMDGIVLWENGSDVSSFIRDLREYILGGSIIRKSAYGQPYWLREAEA